MSTGQQGQGAARSAYAAMDFWFNSTATSQKWREANPGEWERIQDYRAAEAGTPPPEDIDTQIGQMLVSIIDAARWADGTHA